MGMHNAGRPAAAASSYSPIAILKLRIRLRRLRNYCKVEAGRKGEERGEEIRLGPHSEFRQIRGRARADAGGRGRRE